MGSGIKGGNNVINRPFGHWVDSDGGPSGVGQIDFSKNELVDTIGRRD